MFPFLRDRAPEGVVEFRDFGLDRFASGVLFKSDMAAAIVEPLFMSNEYEAPALQATVNVVDAATGLVIVGPGGNATPDEASCPALSCRRGQIVQSVRAGILDYFASPANQPPVASLSSECDGLTCYFDGTASHDPDGTITHYAWAFEGGDVATGATVEHTFASDGTYWVTLTVTDDAGATGETSEDVTVTGGGGGDEFTLYASGYKVKGVRQVDLEWSGSTVASFDILRDGATIATVVDVVAYTDVIGKRGLPSYTYQVCEAGTTVCSNVATVTF
jgi:PKD repeat protein